jgi:two-component system, NtrC family, response regulator AtoC
MKNAPPYYRVMVVDDDDVVRKVLVSRLERKGHTVFVAASGAEALHAQNEFRPEVLISDLRMPEMNGFEVIAKFQVPAIIITGHGDKESAIQAVEAGAFAFFEKPFDLSALEVSVQRAGERQHLLKEREMLLKRLDRLCRLQDRELENLRPLRLSEPRLVGESRALQELRAVLEQLAKKPHSTLLIQGETGTGKEVLAQELHQLTFENADKVPFLALNCATVPQELFESELFGHEKGSFSGALAHRIGLAEAVQAGTLFLDEIGDMAAQHQTKLLRFLQERRFRRVGSNKEIAFRGRIVAATHKKLPELVESGRFREDLYYRLNVITLELPPLRERTSDLNALSEHIAKRFGLHGVRDPERLAHYSWPGNIRELHNWIERAAILEEYDDTKKVVSPLPHVGPRLSPSASDESSSTAEDLSTLHTVDTSVPGRSIAEMREKLLERHESVWIMKALDEHAGNVSAASRALGIDRKNLSRRMKELGLKGPSPASKAPPSKPFKKAS